MSRPERSFITLDGLRAVAAFFVITIHAPAFFTPGAAATGVDPSAATARLFFESYLAVDFFFVLSGFVLCHAYARRIGCDLSRLDFIKTRVIRLYPLYALSFVFSLIVLHERVATGETGASSAVKNVLFGVAFLPAPSLSSSTFLFPLNGPAWSLFAELVANVAFCFVAEAGTVTLVAMAAAAGCALSAAVLLGALGFGDADAGALNHGFRWSAVGASLLRVAFSFFAGVLTYRMWSRRRSSIALPPWLAVAALAAALAATPPPALQTAYDLAVTLFVFPVLVWAAASSTPSGATARLFAALGAASYGVYVLQAPLYDLTIAVFGKWRAEIASFPFAWGLVFIAFVLGVATVADKWLDRPIRAALSARFVARGRAAATDEIALGS
ncbi:acyltransferase [Methylosinus sp. Sm6]|uniref:acyltransferase family protein n=1 Tax=Methylosinus sp. Sm6 TaxID=2866948 RepID=UPI001C99ABAD|nr:acyltransferase [Methylosinus sp. Sm6]MBY6243181.1 acyltransferase [Methylosinus sp. Sm6]